MFYLFIIAILLTPVFPQDASPDAPSHQCIDLPDPLSPDLPTFAGRLESFQRAWDQAFLEGEEKTLKEVFEEYHDFAMVLIRRYVQKYFESYCPDKTDSGLQDDTPLRKALLLSGYFARWCGKPAIENEIRQIQEWTQEQIVIKIDSEQAYRNARGLGMKWDLLAALKKARASLEGFEKINDTFGQIKALTLIGLIGMDLGKYNDPSSDIHSILLQAIEKAKKMEDYFYQATCFKILSNIHGRQQHWKESIDYCNRASEIYSRMYLWEDIVQLRKIRRTVFRRMGRPREAVAELKELVEYYKTSGDMKHAISELYNLALVQTEVDNSFNEALETCEEAFDIADKHGFPDMRAKILLLKGKMLSSMCIWEEATNCLIDADSYYRTQGDFASVGEAAHCIVTNFIEMDRLDEAAQYAEETWDLIAGKVNPIWEARLLKDFTILEERNGNYEAAEELLRKALKIVERVDDTQAKIEIYCMLSSLLQFRSRFDEAFEYAQKSVTLLDTVRFKPFAMKAALSQLGIMYMIFNQHDKARECFERNIKLSSRETYRTRDFLHLAQCMRRMGEYSRAEELLSQALTMAKTYETRRAQGCVHHELGCCYLDQGKIEKALEQYHEALGFYKTPNDDDYILAAKIRIGGCLAAQGKMEEVLNFLNRTEVMELAAGRAYFKPAFLGLIGWAYNSMGDLHKAFEYYEMLLNDLQSIHIDVDMISELSESSFFEHFNWFFVSSIRCCMELYQESRDPSFLKRAFHVEEKRKARTFLKQLERSDINIEPDISENLGNELRACRARINYLQDSIVRGYTGTENIRDSRADKYGEYLAEERKRLEEIMERIRTEDSAYGYVYFPRFIEIEDLQKLLDPSEAFIFYALAQDSSGNTDGVILAADSEKYLARPIRNVSSLWAGVEALLYMMKDRSGDVKRFSELSRELYIDLLAPVEEILKGKKQIIVSLDGILNYLPLEVLLTSDPTGDSQCSYGNLPYLAKSHSVVYVPSGSSYRYLLDRSSDKRKDPEYVNMKDFLAFGDVPYGTDAEQQGSAYGLLALDVKRGDLKPLPHTRREVNSIEEFFSSENTTILLGESASESFKSGSQFRDHRIIHFAAHALVDPDAPLLSSIILNPNQGEDGYLRVYEIYGCSTKAELVVLSACRTNIGKNVVGEGVFGLVRAFLYAGADSVVATNWQVQDLFTADFMDKFYEYLIKEKMPRARAMQEAKKDAIAGRICFDEERGIEGMRDMDIQPVERGKSGYSHPFYWAPFILYGLPGDEDPVAEENR